jgi:hypothetical protein
MMLFIFSLLQRQKQPKTKSSRTYDCPAAAANAKSRYRSGFL